MGLFQRFTKFKRDNKWTDLVRKIVFFVILKIDGIWKLPKRIKYYFFFKKWNISIGKNVIIKGLPKLIHIGDNCNFYDNTILEFGENGSINIGECTTLSYGVLISINKKVSIGAHVQIGEYTSIRDTTHNHQLMETPMMASEDITDPVTIGNNVWVGRGCIIMPGTIINDGVVVGANSVVKGVLEKNCIYAGAPAKFIKSRKPRQ